jgi:hypothetical protein
MMWIAVTTFVLVALSTWFFKAPLESHANPQHTPLHTVAPWYFLWIQGALKLGDKVFWGLVFPGLAFGFLAVVPYLDATPSRRFSDRRFAMTVSFLLLISLIFFSYWGLPTVGVSTSGDIEVLNTMIPEEHAGVLRPIAFDQLAPGAYTTAQFEGDDPVAAVEEFNAWLAEEDNPDLQLVLDKLQPAGLALPTINFRPVPEDLNELEGAVEELDHLMHRYHIDSETSWAGIIITENQANVKRADVFVIYERVADRETGELIRSASQNHTYISENGAWFER